MILILFKIARKAPQNKTKGKADKLAHDVYFPRAPLLEFMKDHIVIHRQKQPPIKTTKDRIVSSFPYGDTILPMSEISSKCTAPEKLNKARSWKIPPHIENNITCPSATARNNAYLHILEGHDAIPNFPRLNCDAIVFGHNILDSVIPNWRQLAYRK